MKQTVKWLADALIALGLKQAVWTDDVSDFQETLQAAEQGNAKAQYNLGVMYEKDLESVKTMHRQCSGIVGLQNKGMPKPNIIWV